MKKRYSVLALIPMMLLTSCGPSIHSLTNPEITIPDNFTFLDPIKEGIDQISLDSYQFTDFMKHVYHTMNSATYMLTRDSYIAGQTQHQIKDKTLPCFKVNQIKQQEFVSDKLLSKTIDNLLIIENKENKVLSSLKRQEFDFNLYDKIDNKFTYFEYGQNSYEKHKNHDDQTLLDMAKNTEVLPYHFDIKNNEFLQSNFNLKLSFKRDVRFNLSGYNNLNNNFLTEEGWKVYQRDDTFYFAFNLDNDQIIRKEVYIIKNFKMLEYDFRVIEKNKEFQTETFFTQTLNYQAKPPKINQDVIYQELTDEELKNNKVYQDMTRDIN